MGSAVKSSRGKLRRVAVVGSGVAGLTTAIDLCEAGVPVVLVSLGAPGQSASAAEQSGFCAALDGGEQAHLEDVVAGGGYLVHQGAARAMTNAAPELLARFARMGVPFERTAEGRIARGASEGARAKRAAYAGSHTGAHLVRCLAQQVRRWSDSVVIDGRGAVVPGEKMIDVQAPCEFLRLVLDDNGVAVGIVVQDTRTMKIRTITADAVCLATGGYARLFADSVSPGYAVGSAAAAVFRQGAAFANAEFVQACPTAMATATGRRAIGERARVAGGRLWAPRAKREKRRGAEISEKERDYFLERAQGTSKNLCPPDVAARAVAEALAAKSSVYLDVSHVERDVLERSCGAVLDRYRKLTGDDPYSRPLAVVPAPHYCAGGIWVDLDVGAGGRLADSPRNHATTIPGLYAAGEVDYQYHGATALGGDMLVSAAFAGRAAARGMAAYQTALSRSAFDLPSSVFEKTQSTAQDSFDKLTSTASKGSEDADELRAELGETLLRECSIERDDPALDVALEKIDAVGERVSKAKLADSSDVANDGARRLQQLPGLVDLARLVVASARARSESRGPHFKRGRPRDDESWLRSTLAVQRDGAVSLVRELEYACAGQPIHTTDAVDAGAAGGG